jgi:hypothetical protein
MDLVEDFAEPGVSVVAACTALGLVRASVYRATEPPRPPTFTVRARGEAQGCGGRRGSAATEGGSGVASLLDLGFAGSMGLTGSKTIHDTRYLEHGRDAKCTSVPCAIDSID